MTPFDNDDCSQDGAVSRHHPPRPSTRGVRQSMIALTASAKRRRRRSSARFLKLTGRFLEDQDEEREHEENGDDDDDDDAQPISNLNELYKKAIRMNAENKINSRNSWNLQLIENIDKFLMDEESQEKQALAKKETHRDPIQETSSAEKRVNFTKASCTLDASVKIYSYRVDDVHLTSYKVLANLNRTSDKKSKNTEYNISRDEESHDREENEKPATKNFCNTIETNHANININKLDSAFDIDPLFHKMSKSFDEGGAKGLLLANLGVGSDGCNIVFDSSAKMEEALDDKADPKVDETNRSSRKSDGWIDISPLVSELDSFLLGQPLESLPLVPQLADLRAEYAELEAEGFISDQDNLQEKRSRRYAPSEEEEKEADRSIHQEALERSQRSAGRSFLADDDIDNASASDYGGGVFDDGDDDDLDFGTFMDSNDGNRCSPISVAGSAADQRLSHIHTKNVLDAIESGNLLLSANNYHYFDSKSLSKVVTASSSNNLWAGSSYWKPIAKAPRTATKKPNKVKSGGTSKDCVYFDFAQKPDAKGILNAKPEKGRGQALLWSKATVTKCTNNDNLLPPDAEISLQTLSSLFMRPKAVVKATKTVKTVGFDVADDVIEHCPAWGDADDDDNDGPGFDFGGDNDDDNDGDNAPFVQGLEDVRKVQKIHVEHATVAKKVDVKRLKRDMWTELECRFESIPGTAEQKESELIDEQDECEVPTTSFQDVVRQLESSKTQADVTLPFYFICILHLANEKGLNLVSKGLDNFDIVPEEISSEQQF